MLDIQELASNDTQDASLHDVAHISTSERRKTIFNGNNEQERRAYAATEISRMWRGYQCRKKLSLMNSGKRDGQDSDQVKVEQKQSNLIKPPSRHEKRIFTRHTAAVIIQRAWRKHIDIQVFRYYRDLINFKGRGDPSLMMRCINPNEAKLLDAASGVHVRFRLAGEKFPPNIYYKIYTHRPVIDMCANSPKDYTKVTSKQKSAMEVHNRVSSVNYDEKQGWYERFENNGWRLVSDRLIHAAMDPVTWESSKKTLNFHHVKLQRKADVEQKRRKRKIEWMKKMYKEGMLKARETDDDTKQLVEKAARGLLHTVEVQGSEAVMDWEVDELLQWTTALNFDDYLETWKESATSAVSEVDVPGMRYNTRNNQNNGLDEALPINGDPYALTRASSMGVQRVVNPGASENTNRSEWKNNSGMTSRQTLQQLT